MCDREEHYAWCNCDKWKDFSMEDFLPDSVRQRIAQLKQEPITKKCCLPYHDRDCKCGGSNPAMAKMLLEQQNRLIADQNPDLINHPPHYTQSEAKCVCGRTIECIDITRHLSFNLGNVVKYIWRCDLKGNSTEDLKKAVFYLNDEIQKRGG